MNQPRSRSCSSVCSYIRGELQVPESDWFFIVFFCVCAEQDDRSVDEIESNRCCNKRQSVAAAVDVAGVSLHCLSLCICSFHKLSTCAENLTEPINMKTMWGQNNLYCLSKKVCRRWIIPKHYLSPSVRCLYAWLQGCQVRN